MTAREMLRPIRPIRKCQTQESDGHPLSPDRLPAVLYYLYRQGDAYAELTMDEFIALL